MASRISPLGKNSSTGFDNISSNRASGVSLCSAETRDDGKTPNSAERTRTNQGSRFRECPGISRCFSGPQALGKHLKVKTFFTYSKIIIQQNHRPGRDRRGKHVPTD